MSMRSRSGPESRDRYRSTSSGPHTQERPRAPQKPHLHRCGPLLPCPLERTKASGGGLSERAKNRRRPPPQAAARLGATATRGRGKARCESGHHPELGGWSQQPRPVAMACPRQVPWVRSLSARTATRRTDSGLTVGSTPHRSNGWQPCSASTRARCATGNTSAASPIRITWPDLGSCWARGCRGYGPVACNARSCPGRRKCAN